METALIVDPDVNNRRMLAQLLDMAGIDSVDADTGVKAGKLYGTQPFDIAIINATLTDVAAPEVARRLRRRMEAENFGPSTRVVVIISSEAKKKNYPAHLVDAFLIPPITADAFARAIGVPSLRGNVQAHKRAETFATKVMKDRPKR